MQYLCSFPILTSLFWYILSTRIFIFLYTQHQINHIICHTIIHHTGIQRTSWSWPTTTILRILLLWMQCYLNLESSLRRLRNRPPLNSLLRLPAPVQTVSKKHGRSSFSGISVTTAPVGVASDNSNSNLILDQNQDPKRQRRQAAATLVQNLPSWTGVGKKSKAQPRPQVQIPPKGIGPVTEPNQNDVLCGRGGRYMEFDERDWSIWNWYAL